MIKFRPHHFMCTLGFQGHGYSLGFVKNYKKIVQTLNSNEDTLIEVVEYMDDICSPCPSKLSETLCRQQDKIAKLDANHKAALHLETGEIISWKSAKQRIKKYMSFEKFETSCDGCSWKEYGVCKKALADLKLME